MIKLSFSLLLFVIVSFTVTAQKLELDRVNKVELLEKQHKTDTIAPAAFLFKNARTEFKYTEKDGFTSTTVIQVKLKIYKTEGLKWANFKIPYYIGYENLDDEFVDIVSGYTYNLENDKIVKTKVTAEGKFREKINENWARKSVTFPNVKVGSIIELEYKFKTQDLSVLPEFQYQYEIPVNSAKYKTQIPEYYIYNAIRKGYVEVESTQKMESTSQSYERKAGYTSVPGTISFNQIVTNYNVTNVPALKEEEYVNTIKNYYGTIEHELKLIRYPDQPVKQIASTWEAVAKSIFEQEQFNTALSTTDYFLNDARLVINSGATPEENIKKVFNFVKNRMNWSGQYGYYPRTKMNLAYANKVGNVAEINLLLVAMLRMAGVEANPVLVSTRDNGVALFPNRTLFNYVIAAVNIDEKTILLDATSKYADLNILPVRDLNSSGRLIKKEGSSAEIDLMPKSNSKDIINIMATISAEGEVSGKIREQYFDYNALVFRERYNGIAKESYIEKLEKRSTGLNISEYDVQNSTDLSLPIIENYSFTSTNSVEGIGDKMYVSPFLYFARNENPFKQEAREYPVDFMFPHQDKFNVSLTIPNGYVVETLPQSKSVSLPDNLGNFKYVISNTGNQIQMLFTLDLNQAVIPTEYYLALKNFFREIVAKQTEKIVLKKV
jgi:transglutaminase-like putative cysteine protease